MGTSDASPHQDLPSLRTRAVVTGANSGIGKAAATGLVGDVTLLVRNRERGERAKAAVESAVPEARVDPLVIDLSSQRAIRDGAVALLRTNERRHWEWTTSLKHQFDNAVRWNEAVWISP